MITWVVGRGIAATEARLGRARILTRVGRIIIIIGSSALTFLSQEQTRPLF